MTSRALLDLLDQAPPGSTLTISDAGQVLWIFLWRLFRSVELRTYLEFFGEHAEQAIRAKDHPNLLENLTAAVEVFRTAADKHEKMLARFR
jgi:hypothetical protein